MSRNLLPMLILAVCVLAVPGLTAADDRPQVLKVGVDGGAKFHSVQAAIDAAPAGAIIQMGPGTFHESVQINKPLTLEGAGAEHTFLTSDWVTLQELIVDGKGVPAKSRDRYDELRPIAIDKEHGEGPVTKQIWQEFGPKPTLAVKETKDVVVRNLSVSMPGKVWKGGWQQFHMVLLENAGARLEHCAFVGSAVDGVEISGNSTTTIQNCLIAGIRSSGIVANVPAGANVEIEHCDVRGCGYAGIKIKGEGHVTVASCRISDVEFHGIRYDDASPTITRNVLFNVHRAGIYIDGDTQGTISHNLFLDCETGGSGDQIVNNTFVCQADAPLQQREFSAIGSRGTASQRIERNVIKGYDHALALFSTDKQPIDRKEKHVVGNLCDTNKAPIMSSHSIEPKSAYKSRGEPEIRDRPLPEGNWTMRVEFTDPQRGDYSLSPAVDWPAADLGAKDYASLISPWAEQPAERAMQERIEGAEALTR